jgi:hypothetical protein
MLHQLTIDTCVINSKGKIPAMNRIEKLHKENLVEIFTTDAMEEELTPGSSQWQKQADYICALRKPDAHKYSRRFEQLKNAVFPTVAKLTPNQEKDIHHLATHLKWLFDFFITTDDRGILAASIRLRELGIVVMTPEAYVAQFWGVLTSNSQTG